MASTTKVIKVTSGLHTADVEADFPVAQVTVSNKPIVVLISQAPEAYRNNPEGLPSLSVQLPRCKWGPSSGMGHRIKCHTPGEAGVLWVSRQNILKRAPLLPYAPILKRAFHFKQCKNGPRFLGAKQCTFLGNLNFTEKIVIITEVFVPLSSYYKFLEGFLKLCEHNFMR